MAGTTSFNVYIDRSAGAFDVSADYYIPGYNDPETGEAFYETMWNFSFSGSDGSYGNSGSGWDSGFGSISLGLAGDTISQGALDFYAVNNFSGEEARGRFQILNAAIAQSSVTLTAPTNPGTQDDQAILLGGAGDDGLTGGRGNDLLDAGAGADTLLGGEGMDTLDGGSGADAMTGGAGDDSYRVDETGDVITEAEDGGHDFVFAGISYTLAAHLEDLSFFASGALDGTGNEDANTITGTNEVNTLSGLGGDDVLSGYAGDDTLLGGEGSDRLEGGLGDDRMTGGAGDDHYLVDSLGDRLVEAAGGGTDEARVDGLARYTLGAQIENLTNLAALPVFTGRGNRQDNVLSGAAGRDRLFGLGGADTLAGGDGNDLLEGGAGGDSLIGGRGLDTASYAGAAAAVSVHLGGFPGAGDAAGDSFSGVENLVGSRFGDSLIGDAGANRIFGGAGDDSLVGGGGSDWLFGGAGADTLIGDGNDGASYAGSAAGVTVDLGAQTASGGDATGDTLIAITRVSGSAEADRLTGSAGANLLSGGGSSDMIDGAGGNDVIRGGGGADILAGGTGLDTLDYAGSAAAVTVNLALGTASGGDAEGDTFTGFERVTGSGHDDTLVSDDGGRLLSGGAGADLITGGAGGDTVVGGAGADTMDGGAGNDTLSYAGSRSYVSVDLESGRAFGEDGQGDSFTGFENLRGGLVSDALYGDGARNFISGGAGGDYIDGRGGNDVITGGSGDDAFVLGAATDLDRIRDFTAGGNEDRILVTWDSRFDTFEEVMAVAVQQGADTVITLSPGIGLVLEGVNRADLTATDFVF